MFYHGANIGNLNVLEACSQEHGEAKRRVLYLTPILPYALFYFRDRKINYVTCGVREDNIVHYFENFPDQLRIIYENQSGYLYSFQNISDIQETKTKGVWITEKNITVENVEFVDCVYERILDRKEKHN